MSYDEAKEDRVLKWLAAGAMMHNARPEFGEAIAVMAAMRRELNDTLVALGKQGNKSGGEIPVPDFGVWLANIPTGPEGWDGLTERDLRDLWSHLPPPKPEPSVEDVLHARYEPGGDCYAGTEPICTCGSDCTPGPFHRSGCPSRDVHSQEPSK